MRIPGVPFIFAILSVIYLTACHLLSGNNKERDSSDVVYLLSPVKQQTDTPQLRTGGLYFQKTIRIIIHSGFMK
jgi:hypothetical protein